MRQADYDLAEHGEPKYAAVGSSPGIAQPVAHEQERGSGDDCWFGTAFVQDPDDEAASKKEESVKSSRVESRKWENAQDEAITDGLATQNANI